MSEMLSFVRQKIESLWTKYPAGYYRDGSSKYYPTSPRLRFGSTNEIVLSKSYQGLHEYIRTEIRDSGAPCYLFDAHNNAFFAWVEGYCEGKIVKGSTLLRFDSHGDEDWVNSPTFSLDNLDAVANYTQQLKIYNFIAPALHLGLVSKVVWISPFNSKTTRFDKASSKSAIPYLRIGIESQELQEILRTTDRNKLITDLDVDYFQPFYEDPEALATSRGLSDPEMELQNDIFIVQNALKKAGLTTVATSPGFIDQNKAIELAKLILPEKKSNYVRTNV